MDYMLQKHCFISPVNLCYHTYMIVFPSILEKSAEEYISQIQKLSKYYSHFQIDIADGIFVSNKTAQIQEISPLFIPSVARSMSHLTFEFHLMVKDYKTGIEKILDLKKLINISLVLVHLSLNPDIENLTSKIERLLFGLVLNPEDEVETIKTKYNLKKMPIIQIMSVHPGAQGNPFIPETLQKIEQLKNANYKNIISLDGGINDTTIPYILSHKFKPDILCPGSFLTRAENLEQRVTYLKEKIAE